MICLFKISDPVKCSISEIFKKNEKQIQDFRDFTEKIRRIYYYEQSITYYKDILSFCDGFLLAYDSIVNENYKNTEILLQFLNNLNGYAHLIPDREEDLLSLVKREAEQLGKIEPKCLLKKYREISIEFKEIKRLASTFYRFDSLLRPSLKFDETTLWHMELE